MASSDDHPNDPKLDSATPTRGPRNPQVPRTWMATHGRDLRFLVIFGILMGVYYWATTTSVVTDRFFPWYLTATTQVSGKTLQAMGYEVVLKRHRGPPRKTREPHLQVVDSSKREDD